VHWLALEGRLRRISNESLRAFDATHNLVAGVGALGAVNAFHLQTSRMSMPVGHVVTHAPQAMQSPAPAGLTFPFARGSPRLLS
jgi:hypothetical protein